MFLLTDADNIRDIAPDVLDADGRIKIMPASYYAGTTRPERTLFCVRHGVYGLHTQELVDFLRELVEMYAGSAIEIGAGNGVLADALGIPATDNHMQERKDIHRLYKLAQQEPVRYGANVQRLDAITAIRCYQPRLVIGSWITHLYRPEHHARGGNMYAPDEREILRNCEAYVMIYNTRTHAQHPLLDIDHKRIAQDWLYSRALDGIDCVGIWQGRQT
ncbi:MAG TPA: hypothetical protein VGQ52_13765 [Gemmatimonadaceae bacterium]|jgi:hypothetical protein|nr:hypothetical protein [Gemmatimonadaceae bacterium]